ncbi:MAG: T9SS type B sorting domain-containing protein [Saonia sp.]
MLPKKPKHLLYAVLLILFSVVCTSAIANTKVYELISEVASAVEEKISKSDVSLVDEVIKTSGVSTETKNSTETTETDATVSAAMFMTIIQGADEEVACTNDGSTLARFNLCGDFDARAITVQGTHSNYTWQRLSPGTGCDIDSQCPETDISPSNTCTGTWSTVNTSATFNLDPLTISAATGAEFRVSVSAGGGAPFYYFKVKKSSITLNSDTRDFICGVPGRIQLLGLSSAYEYSIDGGTSWQTSPVFSGLLPGDYNMLARLQSTPGACEYPYDTITIDQQDIDIDVTFTDAVCFGETGSITVTANNVPGPYRYTLLDDSGNAQEFTSFIGSNSHTFSAVAFGTYSVQVETPQCSGDPTLGIPPPQEDVDTSGNPIVIGNGITQIQATAEHTTSLSAACGINSVDITLNVSNGTGTPPYTYTVSGDATTYNLTAGTDTYPVTSPDTYEFTITDANGCSITVSDSVEEITPPDVTVSGVDGTCTNGGARLEFNVIDAKGYTLSFRADSGDAWSPSSSLSVAADDYDRIQVRYQLGANDCILELSPPIITVTNDNGVDGNAVKIADQSCLVGGGTAGGVIEVQGATGGSGSYEYSIDGVNFGPSPTFNGLLPGTYTASLRDTANPSCVRELTPRTINSIDPPTNLDFALSNIDCAASTVDVTLTPTANAAIDRYEIISPTPVDNGTINVFTGLISGTNYTFRITDANNCQYEESYIPVVESTIRARVKSGGDRRVCPGETDGFGAFIIDGFATDYDYTISGTALSGTSSDLEIPVTGLGAGTYEITVTDNDTNCVATASFDVELAPNPLAVVADVTPMSCQNNNIGRVRATASDGFGGYRYQLDWPSGLTQGPKSGRVFGNLTEVGTYTLTVIDSEGCTFSVMFPLTEVEAPTISLGPVDYCFGPGDDASIEVSSSVGTAPIGTHEYRINGGALQASPVFSGLVPGTYTIEVVDGNSCTDDIQVTIPPQVQVNLSLVTEIPCGGNGEMRININGGDISTLSGTLYTIYLDGNPVTGHTGVPLPSNPFSYNVPLGQDGDYTVEVTDNNGCTNISPPLTFTPPASITATENIVGPSCGDANSGYVEIIPDVSSGTPPFQVAFAPAGILVDDPFNPDPSGTYNYSSQTIYSGLPSGTYEYIVKDARNCTTGVQSITVSPDTTDPPQTTVSPLGATCNSGVLSGGIRIDAIVDGVPNFTIIIEDNFGNEIVRRDNVSLADLPLDINDPLLIEGNYTVITLDSRGCIDLDAVSIDSSDLDIVPDTTAPLVCDRGNLPQCVDIVGGVGPFEIRLVTDPPSAFVTPNGGARRHCFGNLVPGATYTVEVRDTSTNCIALETIDIPDGPNPINVALSIDNANCNGDDVELAYVITGATGPFDIVIRNLDTGAIVTDVTGSATTTDTFLVPQGPYAISVIDDATDCTGGDTVEATLDMPRVDVIDNQNANCNELGQLTVRGSGGTPYPPSGPGSLPDGSPYEYAFVDAATIPNAGDYGTATTVFLPGSLAPGTAYDIWVRDSRGCEFMTSATIVQLNPDLPIPTINVNNQCITGTPPSSFTITVTMPANVDNPTFTLGGETQIPIYNPSNPTTATFSVPSIGIYDVYVVDADGCDVETTAEVFQILSASGSFSTDPTCEDPDGTITVIANGGSGDFTYILDGTDFNGNNVNITDPDSDGIFPGMLPGDYEVLVRDNNVTGGIPPLPCEFLVENIISLAPVEPVIQDAGANDVSCNGLGDGSINVLLQPGTDADGIQEFNLYVGTLPLPGTATPTVTNTSGSFGSLGPNTYVVEVVTDKGCVDQEEVTIADPPVFEISWPAVTFACQPGANLFSTALVSTQIDSPGNGAPYSYRLDPSDSYQSSGDFEIVDNGSAQTITVYAIDANGCESQFTRTIAPPTDVTAIITQIEPMNCADPERIRIDVTGTTNFTVEDQGTSIAAVTNQMVSGASFVVFDLPMVAGEYRLQINDNGGCTYPIAVYTVNEPTPPTVIISEAQRVRCSTPTTPGSDGELFIDVSNYSGSYQYEVFSVDASGTETSTGRTGGLNTSTNPERITGLPGGNYSVHITSDDNPQCPAVSNAATIRTPIPLSVSAVALQEAGCSNDFGQIEATGFGGWISPTTPYQYQLRIDDGSGTYPTIVEAFRTNGLFENLPFGDYQVEVQDEEGCPATFTVSVVETIEIQAEIREPSGLVCPGDNNAVLEVYDPRTGDAVTATQGVSGGVPGAGYKLRLLYLNSCTLDATGNLDIRETGGWQDPFIFIGSSGGTIGAGCYAIEVESGFGCRHFTQPYEVIAPPPLLPNLDLVQVPGCGGDGIMRLRVENGDTDPSVVYEYMRNDGSGSWQDMDEDGNTAVTLFRPEDANAYIFLVREKGSACAPIASDGVTLTDATDVTLIVGTPDDITCANEFDGRIEYTAVQGLGTYEFTLYEGDPGTDAYNPNPGATVIDVRTEDGAFEGLSPSDDYYVGVTSGTSGCQSVSRRLAITSPAPIVVNPTSSPVSCNGEADGSITIEVTSGGVGLLQFAIEPNFDEFFSDSDTPGVFTFDELEAGIYEVLVKDDNGCSEKRTIEVMEPTELQSSFTSTPETCIGFADGTAQLTITGGTPFEDPATGAQYYETSLNSSDDANFVRNDNLFFDNLQGDETYVIFIRDANGCPSNVVIPIEIGVDLTATAIPQYGCDGIFPNSTVSVEMQDTSLIPDLLFYLEDNNSTEPTLTEAERINLADTERAWGDLPPSDYTVHIYHSNGCSNFVEFTIDAYEPLELTAEKTGPNEITAIAQGGFGGYEYFFQGESTGDVNVYNLNEDASVTIRVVDQNGCVASITIPFDFDGMLEIPNFFTPNGDNENDVFFPRNREFFPNIEVKIYDRYGRVVAELNQVSAWDGTYEGNELPSGDYWYVVNANDADKQQYVGHFTLYR